MTEVEVVVAHRERATLRVGDVFLKVDADHARSHVEVEAMTLAPIPTPEVQLAHVFVDDAEVTGVLDWSEAGQGDGMYDLTSLTLGHPGHLSDVIDGYGGDVDLDVIRGWWSLRSLTAIRWLLEHGFDPFSAGCEVDVLKSRM